MPEASLRNFITQLWIFDCANTIMTAGIRHKYDHGKLTPLDLRERAAKFRAMSEELTFQADKLAEEVTRNT